MLNKPNCRLCNAPPEEQVVRAEYVFGGTPEHKFWKCSKCDLVYLYPIPTVDEEKRFYYEEFEKFMENRSADDRNWSGPEAHIKSNQDHVVRRWDFLKDHVKPGDDVLEVGCSSGFMLDDLKNKGINITGIEPSGGFREFLSKKGHEFYSSIRDLMKEVPQKRFDLITHFFVLEHIRDPLTFLQEQIQLLKKNGMIICEVPNVDDPLTSLYNIPSFEKFYWSIAHHYYYSPKSLKPILGKLNCSKYEFRLDQRYDLSNHITWMQDGKPGGQSRYSHLFSKETLESYKIDLIQSEKCDTLFIYIWN